VSINHKVVGRRTWKNNLVRLRSLIIFTTKAKDDDAAAIDSHLQMAFTLGYEKALQEITQGIDLNDST